MVLWIPDWPVNCLVVDLPPGGVGAVVHAKRIEVASASARRCGVQAGMSVREATYLCPELICLPRDPDRETRAFSGVIDAFDTVAAGVECLRPGLARCRARGPARWAGGEEQAASLLVDAIEEAMGVECFVGIADGPLASVEAAKAGRIVPAEDTRFFLSGIGLSRALGCVPPSTSWRAWASPAARICCSSDEAPSSNALATSVSGCGSWPREAMPPCYPASARRRILRSSTTSTVGEKASRP